MDLRKLIERLRRTQHKQVITWVMVALIFLKLARILRIDWVWLIMTPFVGLTIVVVISVGVAAIEFIRRRM